MRPSFNPIQHLSFWNEHLGGRWCHSRTRGDLGKSRVDMGGAAGVRTALVLLWPCEVRSAYWTSQWRQRISKWNSESTAQGKIWSQRNRCVHKRAPPHTHITHTHAHTYTHARTRYFKPRGLSMVMGIGEDREEERWQCPETTILSLLVVEAQSAKCVERERRRKTSGKPSAQQKPR